MDLVNCKSNLKKKTFHGCLIQNNIKLADSIVIFVGIALGICGLLQLMCDNQLYIHIPKQTMIDL